MSGMSLDDGWYFGEWRTRKELLDHLSDDYETLLGQTVSVTQFKEQRERDVCWALHEVKEDDIGFIVRYAVHQSASGRWGYCETVEYMGIDDLGCPLSLLDAAPQISNPEAVAWRKAVREAHGAEEGEELSQDRRDDPLDEIFGVSAAS